MTLSESRDVSVWSTTPSVSAGQKWNLREAVLHLDTGTLKGKYSMDAVGLV